MKTTILIWCWLAVNIIGLSTAIAQGGSEESPWHITAEPKQGDDYYGVTVANGVIGLVSSPRPLHMEEVVLNGTFDTYGRGRVSNILKGFNFANINLSIGGEAVSQQNISQFTQSLHMQTGILTTTFLFKDQAKITYEVTALRHLPYTAFIKLKVEALKGNLDLNVSHEIQAPEILRDIKQYYSTINRPHVKIPLLTSVAQSPTGKHTLAASCSYLFNESASEHGASPQLFHEDWDYGRHFVTIPAKASPATPFELSIVGSVCSTEQYADAHNEAERLTIYAALEGEERLMARHMAAWKALWESDIIIEGDLQAQRDIRFALYHLYAFNRAGTSFSPSPMGLSGLGYNGHVFWDTELWMYPPLLLLQPDMAQSMLRYRSERLAMAKQNAFSHGYKGAMFPWESDDAGQEATPVWALTGPFEHHITGCVGWAFWQYYLATGDKAWLAKEGYPVIEAVADFWVSRTELGTDGKYHINNVVGADEYAENIDDNAFTNGIAITALQLATEAAQILGKTPNPSWAKVANGIPILTFPDGVVKEHATYKGEGIKQADVNLLSYPLQIITDKSTIEKDIAYYPKRMDEQGPAMAHAVISILNARLGNVEEAYQLFKRSYQPNQVPPFNVLAETPGGTNPYFATGAGGMLQTVLFGFGGLHISSKGIVQQNVVLPKSWQSLTIKGIGVSKQTFAVTNR